MLKLWLLVFLVGLAFCKGTGIVEEVFAWRTVDYRWNCENDRQIALRTEDYIPKNVIPLGVARWRNKLFITTPRYEKLLNISTIIFYCEAEGKWFWGLKPHPGRECVITNIC